MADSKPRDLISSHYIEALKTHSVYDASNRLVSFYVADTDAEHGTRCQLTRYTYDGATTRVVGTKEELSNWDSAWDI